MIPKSALSLTYGGARRRVDGWGEFVVEQRAAALRAAGRRSGKRVPEGELFSELAAALPVISRGRLRQAAETLSDVIAKSPMTGYVMEPGATAVLRRMGKGEVPDVETIAVLAEEINCLAGVRDRVGGLDRLDVGDLGPAASAGELAAPVSASAGEIDAVLGSEIEIEGTTKRERELKPLLDEYNKNLAEFTAFLERAASVLTD